MTATGLLVAPCTPVEVLERDGEEARRLDAAVHLLRAAVDDRRVAMQVVDLLARGLLQHHDQQGCEAPGQRGEQQHDDGVETVGSPALA